MSLQLENSARAAYEKIPAESRATMGGCVAALPDADDLQEYLRAIFGRHHPLNYSANEASRIRTSGKLRQNAATELSQFVAFCYLHLKAFHEDKPYSLAR